MRTGALLGLAALAAFIYYCFTREGEDASRRELAPEAPPRPVAGDGPATVPSPAYKAPTASRFHEGDPGVRH